MNTPLTFATIAPDVEITVRGHHIYAISRSPAGTWIVRHADHPDHAMQVIDVGAHDLATARRYCETDYAARTQADHSAARHTAALLATMAGAAAFVLAIFAALVQVFGR